MGCGHSSGATPSHQRSPRRSPSGVTKHSPLTLNEGSSLDLLSVTSPLAHAETSAAAASGVSARLRVEEGEEHLVDGALSHRVDVPEEGKAFCGFFCVRIVKGKGLLDVDIGGKSDPFCVVSFGGQCWKTKSVANNDSPVWNQKVKMVVTGDVSDNYVRFSVYDKNMVMKNHLIGTQEVPLKVFMKEWFDHQRRAAGKDSGGGSDSVDFWMALGKAVDEMQSSVFASKEAAMREAKKRVDSDSSPMHCLGLVHIRFYFQSKEEIMRYFWTQIASLVDKDNNKQLDKGEFQELLEVLRGKRIETEEEQRTLQRIFEGCDADANGKVSIDELTAHIFRVQADTDVPPEQAFFPTSHSPGSGEKEEKKKNKRGGEKRGEKKGGKGEKRLSGVDVHADGGHSVLHHTRSNPTMTVSDEMGVEELESPVGTPTR
eukprot:CAMPEP_0113896388 /NCGR_PEP_ID=MMETSP0780_2-20120614/17986_1 /TAXON_ID=652834 /ORGANISM="Palpitomonas bilix" /LENGTH=428 /DNA_ID=CAMNT_0000887515 /DNA_START=278 /DNA_END=1560 /DNA_ORIENTATION=+ /assembly_acc=CAM_ASM_000599